MVPKKILDHQRRCKAQRKCLNIIKEAIIENLDLKHPHEDNSAHRSQHSSLSSSRHQEHMRGALLCPMILVKNQPCAHEHAAPVPIACPPYVPSPRTYRRGTGFTLASESGYMHPSPRRELAACAGTKLATCARAQNWSRTWNWMHASELTRA